MSAMSRSAKALRIVGIVFALYAVLVATHRGEFWPFSIYPMFSQAGQPWTRALVRKVPAETDLSWKKTSLEDLPGQPFPVEYHGIAQSDLANYVGKTNEWTEQRIRGLRSVLGGNYEFSTPLLVMRVRGRLVGDSVAVRATPVLLYTRNTVQRNPSVSAGADSTFRNPFDNADDD